MEDETLFLPCLDNYFLPYVDYSNISQASSSSIHLTVPDTHFPSELMHQKQETIICTQLRAKDNPGFHFFIRTISFRTHPLITVIYHTRHFKTHLQQLNTGNEPMSFTLPYTSIYLQTSTHFTSSSMGTLQHLKNY